MVSTSAVAVIALLGVTLSACGSGKEPEPGTTSSSSPSSEQSATSADPKAGWQAAEVEGGQFLVPPDWDVEKGYTGPQLQAPRQREGGVSVGGGSLGSEITIESDTAIDDAGDTALAFHKGEGMDKVERLPDASFGGVRFYHVRGEDSARWLDAYGTVSDGQLISILWTFNRGLVDRKQTDEFINQVMPTFEATS